MIMVGEFIRQIWVKISIHCRVFEHPVSIFGKGINGNFLHLVKVLMNAIHPLFRFLPQRQTAGYLITKVMSFIILRQNQIALIKQKIVVSTPGRIDS